MSASTILIAVGEAAGRSLLLGLAVGAGLKLLRTRNVPAQKAAWDLVLAASFAMPWLARWAAVSDWVPRKAAVVISEPSWRPSQPEATIAPEASAVKAERLIQLPSARAMAETAVSIAGGAPDFPAPAMRQSADLAANAAPSPTKRLEMSRASMLLMLYLGICGALLMRVLYGVCAAARLWRNAAPVEEDFAKGLRVRSSARIASPVTIGSGIVLPADYEEWDREKLSIVLAHEASHVRQGDFYLQLFASIYAATFWFSPLGWWLKRTLSDLSETISDRAALEHAASHASYAQVLLEFAALPRPIATGVAMARQGRIVSRIERLLNESSFRQAFAGGRGRIATAVVLVLAAVFGATALVRVQAASTQNDPAPAVAPHSSPQTAQNTAPTAAPKPAAAPQAPPSVQSEGASDDAVPAPPQADPAEPVVPEVAPMAPGTSQAVVVPRVAVAPYIVMPKVKIDNARMMALLEANKARLAGLNGKNFYRFGFGNDGNSYAYVTGEGEKNVLYSGGWLDSSRSAIEKARSVAHGNFIWFERDGKSYVIDDPALLAGLKPMQDQMDALGQKQEALGKQQEELGKQQEALGKQMEQVKIPTPDMKKELEKLHAVEAKLAAIQGKDASQQQLAELQGELADVQGKIGDLQGNMGGQMGDLGGKMGALGSQQGKIGAEQGRIGAQQGRIAREMDGKILSLIDECLKNGKAREVK